MCYLIQGSATSVACQNLYNKVVAKFLAPDNTILSAIYIYYIFYRILYYIFYTIYIYYTILYFHHDNLIVINVYASTSNLKEISKRTYGRCYLNKNKI